MSFDQFRFTRKFVNFFQDSAFKTDDHHAFIFYTFPDTPESITVVQRTNPNHATQTFTTCTFNLDSANKWLPQKDSVQSYTMSWGSTVLPISATEQILLKYHPYERQYDIIFRDKIISTVKKRFWSFIYPNKLLIKNLSGNLQVINLQTLQTLCELKFDSWVTQLFSLNDGTVFFYLHNKRFGIIDTANDNLTVSYWGIEIPEATSPSFKHISQAQYEVIGIVPLTSTSFIALSHAYLWWFNNNSVRSPLIIFRDVADTDKVTRVSSTSFVLQQHDTSFFFQQVHGIWRRVEINLQYTFSVYSLDVGHSFLASNKDSVIIYRMTTGMLKTYKEMLLYVEKFFDPKPADETVYDDYYKNKQISIINPDTMCVFMRDKLTWGYVDIVTNDFEYANIQYFKRIQDVCKSFKEYSVYLQDSLIIVSGRKTNVMYQLYAYSIETWHYDKKTYKLEANQTILYKLYTSIAMCYILHSKARDFLQFKLIFYTDKPSKNKSVSHVDASEIFSSWSNRSHDVFILFTDNTLLHFNVVTYVHKLYKLPLFGIIQKVQPDTLENSYNFFFKTERSNAVRYAVFTENETYSYIVTKEVWQENTDYCCFDKDNTIHAVQGCMLRKHNDVVWLQTTQICLEVSKATLNLLQFVQQYTCTETGCTEQSDEYGICNVCQANVSLKEGKCKDMQENVACVPRLRKSFQKTFLPTLVLPKGTLLYHSTLATCQANQDETSPTHHVFYEQGQTPKDNGITFFGLSPWISLQTHFYYRVQNAWGSSGYYTKLVSNTEQEILSNAVFNDRPGAILVYELTEDMSVLDTSFNFATGGHDQDKETFCRIHNLMCAGEFKYYQDNDYGITCFALENKLNGFAGFVNKDSFVIDAHRTKELKLQETCFFEDDISKSPILLPPYFSEPSSSVFKTFEIGLTAYKDKMKLVSWTDACLRENVTTPKDKMTLYYEMLGDLQSNLKENVKIPYVFRVLIHENEYAVHLPQRWEYEVVFSDASEVPGSQLLLHIEKFICECFGMTPQGEPPTLVDVLILKSTYTDAYACKPGAYVIRKGKRLQVNVLSNFEFKVRLDDLLDTDMAPLEPYRLYNFVE